MLSCCNPDVNQREPSYSRFFAIVTSETADAALRHCLNFSKKKSVI